MSITDSLNGIAPPATRWNVLSLGAGVQSSTLALMASHGEVGPMPDFAVFADTQAEPKEVYDWLHWLEKHLAFHLYRVTAGSLANGALEMRETADGRRYTRNVIPAYTLSPDGSKGMVGRQCTHDYKIAPLDREVKRRTGVRRGQKDITVTQWMGISFDEIQRMKPSRNLWQQNRWPLVERQMRRHDCLNWMAAHDYPLPPRSACTFCPYHSDGEWRRLKLELPDAFRSAVEFEVRLQEAKAQTDNFKAIPFLHRSLRPLDQVDFSTAEDNGQQRLFNNECEGMCGV